MKNFKLTTAIILTALIAMQSCKKESPSNSGTTTTTTTVTAVSTGVGTGPGGSIVAGTDPAAASTQGFFLDNWAAKTFTVPSTKTVTKPSSSGATSVTVDLSQITTKVSGSLFGNNINPFMGQVVTEPVLMNNLTALSPNIIRAPGGSLSDIYFWNGDGSTVLAPADAPPTLLNSQGVASASGYWYGNDAQSWTLSLTNYYSMLLQTHSTGLITVNYGYARYGTGPTPVQTAANLAASWVKADNGRTQYWEVGNENFGNWEAGYEIDVTKNQDGQPAILTGTVYGTHFKVFAAAMRAVNPNIKIGIVLTNSNDVGSNQGWVNNWNHDVLTAAGNSADFFVVHNYYTPYNDNSSPSTILSTAVPSTSSTMSWVKTSAQNAGVTQKPVAMDEWNIQATGSSQNVSNIAGLHAVMVLGEILKNQFGQASRWDLANAWDNGDDQGMFSNSSNPSEAEPNAPTWNPRPAFYYMYYFQKYFGDRMVSSTVSGSSDIVSYGSSFTSGQAGVVLVNQGSIDHVVNVAFNNFAIGTNYYYFTLNGGTDNSPFSHNVFINGTGPASGATGGPATYASVPASSAGVSGGITVTVPAYGAVYLVVDNK